MLAIVPLLAATWPFVRAVTNHYHLVLAEASVGLEHAAVRLHTELDKVDRRVKSERELTDEIRQQVARITRTANEFTSTSPTRTIDSPLLPASWAVAFFAAFFVVLGRTVFQTCCPDAVQKNNEDQYVDAAASQYLAAPSVESLADSICELEVGTEVDLRAVFFDAKNQDHRIQHRLLTEELCAPDFRETRLHELLHLHDSLKERIERYFQYGGKKVQIPSAGTLSKKCLDHLLDLADGKDVCTAELRDELRELERISYKIQLLQKEATRIETTSVAMHRRSTIIQRAARKRYKKLTCLHPRMAFVCEASYGLALFLITWIVLNQCLAVGEAAGLWPTKLTNLVTLLYWFSGGVISGVVVCGLLITIVLGLLSRWSWRKKHAAVEK